MELRHRDRGDHGGIFDELNRVFESTFGELIPGILHDFASPLNGIIGRSELLGRRVEKTLERVAENGNTADGDILEDCKKIHDDAGLLAREANRLFDLFTRVGGKFRTLKERSGSSEPIKGLRADLKTRLNAFMGGERIRTIYLTKFVLL